MTPPDELLASENRLMVLLGCTKGIVFEFDKNARYVNVWTHDDSLLAKPRAELIGQTIDSVLGKAGAKFTEIIQRVFRTGVAETFEYELAVQGGRCWFSADVVIAPNVPGNERTVVYLVRDVTAHKHLEEQLRQSQKMEAIGQLAGGVAHDFNNILTTIIGYSELLLSGLEPGAPTRKHAARIRHSAERAAALTRQLLVYSRKQLLVPEILDVNVVITNLGHMLRRLIGEHIDLQLDLAGDIGGVKVDRTGLEQVIMNLSLNARDALGDGGRLTLSTANVEIDDAYCASRVGLNSGHYVRIVATDNGQGMDDATKARIFEPFFTTKEVGRGTGLGLSTVYGIVRQSGGHIEVTSSPARGASFVLLLPRVAFVPSVIPVPTPRPHAGLSGLTVLVVEDDADVRELVDRYLSGSGYEVVLAAHAAQALQCASERSIDLLITDLVMPGMSGRALATGLRKSQPAVRVLYMSGYPDDPRGTRVARVANSRFLQKPFTKTDLEREVSALFQA